MTPRRARAVARTALRCLLILSLVSATLPADLLPSWVPLPFAKPAAAETLASPRYIAAAVMPNGHVGLIFQNVDGSTNETRFVRYTDEYALGTSFQLSTAASSYPQLAKLGSSLVAAYVDTRSPNIGKLILRTSSDNGVSWTSEANPFGTETFDADKFAPRLVASRDGTKLYLFSATNGQTPKYRYTTDLSSWTSAVNAGDASMRLPSANNCGSAGQECIRAHAFGFMETATTGSWVYVAKSDAGWGQSGRGTQVGTLGGSWSTQVDHGGSGGISGGGDSTATTFLGRGGEVYYLRAGGYGDWLYYRKSTDGGLTWSGDIHAYWPFLSLYTTAAPVGLYVPTYTSGEYVWYAGFGGGENTVRVIPLWSMSRPYVQSGTVRLFGSAGSDLDPATKYPYNFAEQPRLLGAGGYTTGATDLTLPGRVLPLVFGRTYNSANPEGGALGVGWTHSYEWSLVENGDVVTIKRGSGRRDRFTRNGDGSYAKPSGVFDTLVKNGDGSFTLTTREQVTYDFVGPLATQTGDMAAAGTPSCPPPYSTYVCARAFDTNDTTQYVADNSGGGGQYSAVVDLGEARAAQSFRLVAGCFGVWRRYYIEGSTDGTSWTTRYDSLTDVAAGDTGTITFSGGPHTHRFWRVRGNGTASCGYQLFTFTLNGPVPLPSAGKLTRISEPAGNQITLSYATGGRLSTVTDTVGRVLTLGYGPAGLLTTIQDAAGRVVRYGYVGGRLAFVWDRLATGALQPYATRLLADSPAAYWRLGESSGTSAADAGPNSLTGTYSGGYTLGVTGAIAADSNPAVGLNGGTGRMTAGTTGLPMGSTARTLEAWVQTTSGGPQTIASYGTPTTRRSFALKANEGGADRLGFWTYGDDYVVDAPGLTDGLWHHAAVVYDGALTIDVYYDGTKIGSKTLGAVLNTAADANGFVVGRDYFQPYSYFNGAVDEVAVFATALSGTQIAARPFGPPSWQYAYDGTSRHLTKITDPDGRVVVTNTYDTLGRIATQKDGLNNTTTFGYPSATQSTVTDPRSHTTTLSYDARSRPIQQDDPVGGTTYHLYFTYDDCGNRSSVTDRNGNRTDYTFDTVCRGNLEELEEPQLDPQTPRFTTAYEYDTKNNLTQVTDAKGFITTHTYHATSNVRLSTTSEIDASTSATTKYEYSDAANPGLVTKVIAPRGNLAGSPDYTFSTALSYDSSGNLTQTIDADGAKTTHTYDSVGRRLTTVDPDGYASGQLPADHTWTTTYDANDRVLTETNPLSQTATNTYFGAGQLKTATDRRGNVTTYLYDIAGRLWKVQQKPNPSGQPTLVYETVVGRDANGNATSVTRANGAVTDYAYDALNRLTTTTVYPSGGVNLVTTLVLDGNGNVLSRTTADSVVTTYTYDNLSRLKTVSASGLSTITYGYDELSRRISMQDGTGTTTYSYDGLDRLTSAAQPNGTVSYGYDRDSNRTAVTYPGTGGGTVSYVYSSGGRLSSLTDWSSRTSTYTYHASGLADTVSVPGGMTIDYGYDRAQRLTSLTNKVGATSITTHAYTLDAEGNRTQLVEFLSGVTGSGQTETFGYTYDGLNRLTAVTTTNAEGFTLDGASNVTARTGPSATYTIDGENRPTSDGTNTFTWSNSDRLTGRGSDTFGYDALDRLTSSTVASTSRTYGYSGDGLLQSRTQGSTTSFLWDAGTNPSRLLAQGGDRIIYGLGPLYIIRADGTTRALARDGGKSVRAEVNGSGAVTGSWRYRAYGEINQTSGQSTPSILGYAGQLLDPSGLYYMRARWYDAASGRFMTRDPLAFATLENPFGYAAANPNAFADPSGLRVDPISHARPPCTCMAPVSPQPPGDIQPAPDWAPTPGADCCITHAVARGPLTLIFPMPPKIDDIFRDDPVVVSTEPKGRPPVGAPVPPGYDPRTWDFGAASRGDEVKTFWDPDGGEWRHHPVDPHHPEHWDYNPWTKFNSPWEHR